MKILKAVELGGLSLILTGVIILFEYNNWPAGSSGVRTIFGPNVERC